MALNKMVLSLEESTRAGTAMVFGYLGGGPLPFDEKFPGSSFVLAFRALPLVLVISALSALLFYWKILPVVVRGFSRGLEKSMGLGGAEGLGVSANIFVGMVEAPLFIRPYLARMTRSELFTLMASGMATIAGTVMVLYASILSRTIPDIMGHILTASIISVPAAVVISKIMVPETDTPTSGKIKIPETANSAMDAITRGTVSGIQLLINIVAMLVVLVALVHPGQPDPGAPARDGRPGHHPATGAGHPHGAHCLAHGGSLGRGHHRRRPHGHQNDSQRTIGLPRPEQPACRYSWRSQ